MRLQYAESTELFCGMFSAEHYLDSTTQQAAIQIAEGRGFRFGGQRGQVEIAFPGSEHEFDVAVATHKKIPLVVQTRVDKLKRNTKR